MSRILFTAGDERDEPIEWTGPTLSIYINPPANGLTVEEVTYDDFLAAREEQARKEKREEAQSNAQDRTTPQSW